MTPKCVRSGGRYMPPAESRFCKLHARRGRRAHVLEHVVHWLTGVDKDRPCGLGLVRMRGHSVDFAFRRGRARLTRT